MEMKIAEAVPKREKLGYYGYFVGQNIVFMFVTIYLSVYYTTALGIPAAVVGTILLLARIWDAVNDPLLSIIIEKANLRRGKFKPWIQSVAILIPLLTVAIFSFTDLLAGTSLGVRVAYAAITYVLWGMAYTISDAPAYAMATVMTTEMNERNKIISFAKFSGLIGVMIAMLLGPQIIKRTNGSWVFAAVILSAIAMFFLLGISFAKERKKTAASSPGLKDILGALVKNKYLVIIVLTMVAMNGCNFGMTVTPFMAEYVFGNPALSSAILATFILPMLIAAPFVPRLVAKFGKNALMKFSLIVVIIFSLLSFFIARDSFMVFMILSMVKSILGASVVVISALYFADAIEYDYYLNGRRYEAAVFSAQTMSSKAISAISGAGAMYLIGLFGFKESLAGESVVQTAGAVNGIWMTYNIGPAVGALFALIIFTRFYDMNETKLEELGRSSGRL